MSDKSKIEWADTTSNPGRGSLPMHDDITALGDTICELLTFCYKPKHKRSMSKSAKQMGGTYEQFVAAALAQCLAERFEIRRKVKSDPDSDTQTLSA